MNVPAYDRVWCLKSLLSIVESEFCLSSVICYGEIIAAVVTVIVIMIFVASVVPFLVRLVLVAKLSDPVQFPGWMHRPWKTTRYPSWHLFNVFDQQFIVLVWYSLGAWPVLSDKMDGQNIGVDFEFLMSVLWITPPANDVTCETEHNPAHIFTQTGI